ncbi:MAG: SAVED domain-containing protein [Candidatus Paceibacterota bacterium]
MSKKIVTNGRKLQTQAGTSVKSPVTDVTRSVKANVRLQLCVSGGGRCEFDGCNEYLFEHPLTLTRGNFSEAAHIVAFKENGARGKHEDRPLDINGIDNLMLLCQRCHKLIDDNPGDYSKTALVEYKNAHEARIKHVTGLGPERKTAVLVLKAPINGQTVTVPFGQIVSATSPQYPEQREPETIDLTTISDKGDAFIQTAKDTIEEGLNSFLGRSGLGRKVGHISVFGLGPIPLLIFLGSKLSNKVPTEVFQRHRDTEDWTWKTDQPPVQYSTMLLQKGTDTQRIALVLSLSGTISVADLPNEIKESSYIYSITLDGIAPNTSFLKTRQDIEGFRTTYQEMLGFIMKEHGLVGAIDVFPAIPAPIAVLCGRELLPKVHPSLCVWDYNKANGGFIYKLNIN